MFITYEPYIPSLVF